MDRFGEASPAVHGRIPRRATQNDQLQQFAAGDATFMEQDYSSSVSYNSLGADTASFGENYEIPAPAYLDSDASSADYQQYQESIEQGEEDEGIEHPAHTPRVLDTSIQPPHGRSRAGGPVHWTDVLLGSLGHDQRRASLRLSKRLARQASAGNTRRQANPPSLARLGTRAARPARVRAVMQRSSSTGTSGSGTGISGGSATSSTSSKQGRGHEPGQGREREGKGERAGTVALVRPQSTPATASGFFTGESRQAQEEPMPSSTSSSSGSSTSPPSSSSSSLSSFPSFLMATAGAAALMAPSVLEPEEAAVWMARSGDSMALGATPSAPRAESGRSRLVATGGAMSAAGLLDGAEAGPVSASLGSTESAAECQSPVSLSSLGSSNYMRQLYGSMDSGSRSFTGTGSGTGSGTGCHSGSGSGSGSASMHRQLSWGSGSVPNSPMAQAMDSVFRFPSVDALPPHAGRGATGRGSGPTASAGSAGSARGPGGGGTRPIADRTSDLHRQRNDSDGGDGEARASKRRRVQQGPVASVNGAGSASGEDEDETFIDIGRTSALGQKRERS